MFGSVYPKDNEFRFGHEGGKFVWGDLKDSDKVGSYPYPKNDKDRYQYWENLGAPKWLYGGIFKYDDRPKVYVQDKVY